MRNRAWALAALFLASAVPASAAWHKVSSPHFVIYADAPPERLRAFAERLERFDLAVRQVRRMPDPPLGDGNRLTVFVVDNVAAVRSLAAATTGMTKNLAGFYKATSDGSIAVVPERSGNSDKGQLDDQEIFFHEYAHHLMFSDTAAPVPLWYAEGFAEFMSTADFAKDGSVTLGRVVTGRGSAVADKKTFPLERMLSGSSDKLSEDEWEQLYARGWLLTHYLTFEPSRKGQMQEYLGQIAKGVAPTQAAAVFGDLGVLDHNLHAYLGRNRLSAFKIAPEALRIGRIDVAPVSSGAAAILPSYMKLKADVPAAEKPSLVAAIRAAGAAHLDDPFVQTVLAGLELDANDYPKAEAAADRALAADPGNVQAMVYKGEAILEQAAEDKPGKTFAAARQWAQKANALDPEDPEPLVLFYQVSVRDSGRPSANAIAAMHQAARLAPQDLNLRVRSAWQHLTDNKLAEARALLVPLAYDPHGGSNAKRAQTAIMRIDAADAKGAQSALGGS